MIMKYVYKFPVVRGVQAKKEYYIAMVPLKMLSRLFTTDSEYVLPEYRAQRKLNESRIPVISKYILDNRDTYVFSALAASIDGEFSFVSDSINPDVSMDAKFLINDGQHRKSAILEAMSEEPSLGDETISIVFFADKGLKRSQQIFTDLNKNAVKTSNSISELYDSRDEMAVITRNVIWNIEFLNSYTDKERDNLGKYSSKLFALNAFYSANKTIIGRKLEKNTEEFLMEYWKTVVEHMMQWQALQNKEITKVDLREQYIATQNIVIQALGRVGNYFYNNPNINMHECIEKLDKVDWNRNARIWYLRAISETGRIITNKKATLLIANVLKAEMGIPLSEEEQKAEDVLQKTIGEQVGDKNGN
jgi:DNA sulfur modification protein DndB